MLKKLFLFLIKYIPIIQMVGIILTNTCCYFNVCNEFCYLLNFFIGNSTITTILLLVCSYLFKFCNWYKLIVISNFIIIIISTIDIIFTIPVTNFQLLMIYYIVYLIFILIIIIKKFKCNERKSKETTS